MNGPALAVIALGVALVASAVGLVHVQHDRRVLFAELQQLERERDRLQVEWGQLRLEQGVWTSQEHVERVARERLSLGTPDARSVVLVER